MTAKKSTAPKVKKTASKAKKSLVKKTPKKPTKSTEGRAGTSNKSIDRNPQPPPKPPQPVRGLFTHRKDANPERWRCPKCDTSTPNQWSNCKRCGWCSF